jgi:aspartate carbamoyltransferase catalytic subunit
VVSEGVFPPHNNFPDKAGAAACQDKFKDWICTQELTYMHCGPADRDQEVTDGVIDNANYSLYFEEAEIRLHVHKAIMSLVMGDRKSRHRN